MEILTDKTFWIIIGVIILLMAIVGYLADGMDLTKNKKEKPKKEKNKKLKEKEIEEIPLVNSDYPVEVLKTDETPNAWTGNIETKDKNETQIYNLTAGDDWQGLPTLETNTNEYSETPQNDIDQNYNELPNQITPLPQDEQTIQNKEEINYNNDNQNENIWR